VPQLHEAAKLGGDDHRGFPLVHVAQVLALARGLR
jgi:hypothetical protein